MRTWWIATFPLVSCGFPDLARLSEDGASGASADAPTGLIVEAAPASFDLHVNDTRDTHITVTNHGALAIAAPHVSFGAQTLATLTLQADTCTAGLAPGASCTATGHLVAIAEGQASFTLDASASSLAATAPLTAIVRPACPATCGPAGDQNCCDSPIVPGNAVGATLAGKPFYRSNDVATDGMWSDKGYPATVSDFRLDRYEVTVGRFRAFVDAGMGTQLQHPVDGSGAHPYFTSGWDPMWTASLPADKAALAAALACHATLATWKATATTADNLPINCVTWYEAAAFCNWDGGYLPTEAEWNYAAAGGSEQRAYPWSSPADTLTADCSYANHDVNAGPPYCVTGGGATPVGADSPKGDGKWGHADLGGNVWEWTFDFFDPMLVLPCDNCANLKPAPRRTQRSGSMFNIADNMRTGRRNGVTAPDAVNVVDGIRCARNP